MFIGTGPYRFTVNFIARAIKRLRGEVGGKVLKTEINISSHTAFWNDRRSTSVDTRSVVVWLGCFQWATIHWALYVRVKPTLSVTFSVSHRFVRSVEKLERPSAKPLLHVRRKKERSKENSQGSVKGHR